MLSASAHKLGGPKGVGFLYIREGVKVAPWLFGGGQEKNLRSGTENVPGIIGFARAVDEYKRKTDKEKIRKLRDRLIVSLEKIGGCVNGAVGDLRIFNNVHVSFSGIESESLVMFLSERGIYVSAGSACDSQKDKEDYVLKALGLSEEDMRGSIRISLGSEIDEKDVDFVVEQINKVLKTLREV